MKMEKPLYLLLLLTCGLLSVYAYPMNNEDENREGYYGVSRVTPEMVGLLDAIPGKLTVDRSDILNGKATVKVERSMPKSGLKRKRSIRESDNHPMKYGKARKRSVHTSNNLRSSRKRSAHDSKKLPFRNGKTRKRSVNEMDMPPMKRSSIEIEAFDSKSNVRTLKPVSVENSTATSTNSLENSTAKSTNSLENSTAKSTNSLENSTDTNKNMSENANVVNNNTMEAHKNQSEVSNKTSDAQKTDDFPAVEDGLLQMTHNLLSDITGFRENVAEVKEATLSKHGADLRYQMEVQKRPGQVKRNKVAGGKQGVNPLSVMVSKTRFEDYLINRFLTYVCDNEC